MGIWDSINSATDKMKRNVPDLSSVRHACRSSYDYGWTAVTKIDNAVRKNGVQRLNLNQYVPDDEGRAKIGRFATCCAKNAAFYAFHEGIKCVPGGVSIYNVVSRSLVDKKSLRDEKTEDYKEVIETLQARIGRLEKESSCGCKKLHNQAEMLLSCDAKLDSQIAQCLDSNGNQKPEEVLRIFMMKEFVGGHIFDDLLIPGVPHRKNQK